MPLNEPIKDWTGKRVWVVGASQGIGEAIARLLIAKHAKVALSARNALALEGLARLAPAGDALVLPLDVTDPAAFRPALTTIIERWDGVDLVLLVAGTHRAIRAWELEASVVRGLVETNLMGALNALEAVVPQLLTQGHGAIGIVSSVAGYRGLPTGLIYGATKAALINLAETLYLDLRPRGLSVYLINPGFVKTPLTDRNEFPMPALISAEEAAQHTLRGLERGAFEIHYPKRFTCAMKLLRMLPYRLYFALVHRTTGL
jgi:NAD(P)-dependent dehydrogenase (short-subunit alcohol dehydrogenase family)